MALSDQRSVRASMSRDLASACSGAMNAGVPSSIPVPVPCPPEPSAAASRARAIPKSRTFTVPSVVTKRFCGLMSRCTIPLSCAAASTSSTCSPIETASVHREALARACSHNAVDALAVQQLHDEERRAVLADVVVDDAHGAGVLDGVRGVAFAQEARAEVLAQTELRVEHLDGELGLVPVRRRGRRPPCRRRRGRRRCGTCREGCSPRVPGPAGRVRSLRA